MNCYKYNECYSHVDKLLYLVAAILCLNCLSHYFTICYNPGLLTQFFMYLLQIILLLDVTCLCHNCKLFVKLTVQWLMNYVALCDLSKVRLL